MNQTSLSVAEVGKTSALLQTGAGNTQSSGEASESEGFLSVLSSVFSSETEGGEEVSAEGAEVSEAELGKSEVDAESVGELLELETAEGGEEGEELPAESEDAELVVAQASSEGDESADLSADKKSANPEVAKAMSEGSALLERLDESSQALQAGQSAQVQSGKVLPQSEAELTEVKEQLANSQQTSVENEIYSDPLLSKYIKAVEQELPEDGEEVTDEMKLVEAEKVESLKAAFESVMAGKATEGDVPEQEAAQQLSHELKALKAAKVQSEQTEISPDMVMQQTDSRAAHVQPEQNEGELQDNKLVWDTAKTATAIGVGAALGNAVADTQNAESIDPVASSQVIQEAAQIAEGVDPNMLSEEELAAMAKINWGASTASSLEGAKVSPELKSNNQAQVNHLQNQQLHQQLQQAQAQALSQGAEKAAAQNNLQHISPELSSAAMQSNAMAQAMVQQPQTTQAANKAALTASALTLGAAGGVAAAKGSDKDKDLSQQLAGLTSQQGVHQAQVKNDIQQAVQQSPLQLAKEAGSQELAERVQMMLSKNLRNVDIRLDPPELGRMQIRMSMNGDMASVQFTVSNPQAREMVEHAMPRLREMLSQQGVQLADSSVHQQNSGQQQREYATGDGSSNQGGSGGMMGDDEANLDESINLDVNIASKDDGISYYA